MTPITAQGTRRMVKCRGRGKAGSKAKARRATRTRPPGGWRQGS